MRLDRRQDQTNCRPPSHHALVPLVDSAGIKFLGDGDWQPCKHCVQAGRQRRKVHLAVATSDIRAVEFTPSSDGDSPVGVKMRFPKAFG